MTFNGLLFGVDLLFVPIAIAVWVLLSKETMQRLVALQLLTTLIAVQMVVLSIVFATEEFADLGVLLALASAGGAFAYAHFYERWL